MARRFSCSASVRHGRKVWLCEHDQRTAASVDALTELASLVNLERTPLV
jgi:hypothetical protein